MEKTDIKKSILDVIARTGLNRMPSASEIVKATGNYALTNEIARSGGFRSWAELLGLNMKSSDSLNGWKYEEFMFDLLKNRGFDVKRMTTKYPYDLLVNSSVKVDVKGSKKYLGKNGNFYSFNLEKPSATCDIFTLCIVGAHDDVERVLVVPAAQVQFNTQLGVGEHCSKYDQYSNRFDIIERYCEFISGMIA